MKQYVYNPSSGSPVKNWYDGSSRWSLDKDEVKAFPPNVAEKLVEIYGFLQLVSEEEAESKLAQLENSAPSRVKVAPTGELVPKSEDEIKADEDIVKVKKESVKKLVKKVKAAKDAEPENPPYDEWSRGELIAEAHKRKVEIKGLGKNPVSKEQIIMLLENDDASK